MIGLLVVLVVAGTSIWVAVDASRLGVKRGSLNSSFVDMGPAGWFFSVLLIWIIGFPLYLVTRPKYVALRQVAPTAALPSPTVQPTVQPTLPPPGWYPDPTVSGGHRWWDGREWGPSSAPQPQPPPRP